MQTLPLPRLAHNGLAAPTADDFRDAIRAIAPAAFESAWTEVCANADVPRGAVLLEIAELERLAKALTAKAGVLGVVGRSMEVRVASYKFMAAQSNANEWRPRDWSSTSLETLILSRIPDQERIEVLADLNPFTEEAQYKADELARATTARFGARVTLITALTDEAQFFVGKAGIDGAASEKLTGSPLEWSFCTRMVRTGAHYAIRDTGTDVLQRHNPVTDLIGRGAYLGVPMVSNGKVIGSVCIFTDAPRDFTDTEISELEKVAKAAVSQLEADRDIRI